MLKNLIEILYSTDAEGYPLPAHVKIARMQNLVEKSKQQQTTNK